MHEFTLSMRWSDLDQLGHVNNVVIVDWALLAQRDMADAGVDGTDRPVTGIHTSFARPFLLSYTPVVVRSRVEGDDVVHDIAPQDADQPFATVTIRHGVAKLPAMPEGQSRDLLLRRTDLRGDRVSPRALFELCQEARVQDLGRMLPLRDSRFVVARVDLDVGEPIAWRSEPLDALTAVTHVGRSSWTITTWFDRGRGGAATAILVAFDTETQTSRKLTEAERTALNDALV